jgi:hypothetical protein
VERLRQDVEALAALVRDSAGAGENESARWIAARLREAGATDVRLERYRYRTTAAVAHAVHVTAGLIATRLPRRSATLLGLAALVSLERTELLLLTPGSEESKMGGMRAFLAGGCEADLVLGLDTLGITA